MVWRVERYFSITGGIKKSSNSSRIEIIKVNDLKNGEYALNIIVEDLTTGDILSSNISFTITDKPIGLNQMLPMGKNDIKKYLNQIKYIATYEEKKLFKKNKRGFIEEKYEKQRDRNEALDLVVYQLAAVKMLQVEIAGFDLSIKEIE